MGKLPTSLGVPEIMPAMAEGPRGSRDPTRME